MATIYNKHELQEILDAYAIPDTRDETIEHASQLLQDFADDATDIEQDALDLFLKIIETFGMQTDNNGNKTLTQIGARAMARYQSVLDSLENAANITDDNRIYSLTSDQNQIKFDLITLNIFKDMALVDAYLDPSNMTPAQIATTINNVELNETQRAEYANKFIDNVISNPELFELVPPKKLAEAYDFTKQELAKKPNDKKLSDRFTTLAKRIDYLIKNFASKVDYFYSDPSNIADVYAGYRKMCDIRVQDLKASKDDNDNTKKYKQEIKKSVDETNARLEDLVSMYSDMWNLSDLKPADAKKLDTRWREISDKLKDVELTDQLLKTLAKYEFLDEKGKPLPQFIDEHGHTQHGFEPGYKLNPDGRLNRIISLAKTDVAIQHVGDLKHNIKDIDLTKALFDRVPWKMSEISVPDQVISDIISKPHKLLSQPDVDKFWDELDKNGGKITDSGYQSALDAQVNQIAGFAGMLAQKVGDDQAIIMRPFESIEDIDKLATTRTEKIGASERKQKVGFFKRMLKNFSAATVMSAGLTFIGKATGVAYAGAAIGTTIGIGNMIVQGFKWRREQKKAGKPHGLKAFFSDKRNYGPAIASGLGIAATICMATGNPELAAGLGIGAMAIGGGTSAKMVYDDALAAGYTRGQALAGALGVVGATIAGGFAGHAAMNGLVNYVNNHTESNLFKTETLETTERISGTERTYDEGVIKHHQDMMLKNHWETPQSLDAKIDGLMDAGLSHDDAMRYLLAWHDTTDHNLGPGYFNSIGMSPDALAALRGSISGTTINLTPESIAAFEHFNPHISALNQVGYVPGAPVRFDLPANATYDSNGVIIPGNDFYTTYANGETPFTDVPIITTETTSVFTPNELAFPAGIGTVGVYEPRVVPNGYLERMHERAGALADRVKKMNSADDENVDDEIPTNTPTVPPITPEIPDDKIDIPGNEPTPGVMDIPRNKKTYIKPEITVWRRDIGNGTPDTPSAPEKPTGDTDTDTPDNGDTKPQKRGFFGTCKDIAYNIMQSVYHGLLKTQQGVHKMKTQRIKNQTERKLLKQQGQSDVLMNAAQNAARQKEFHQEHGLDTASMDKLTKENISIMASQNAELIKKLSKRHTKLLAKLNRANAVQRNKIEQELTKIDGLTAQYDELQKIGGIDAIKELHEMKKWQNNVEKLIAMGENEVESIQDAGREASSRSKGQRFFAAIKGIFDKTEQDIKSERINAELGKLKLATQQSKSAAKIYKAASAGVAKVMKNGKLSENQKNKMADIIIQDALRQIEKTK